MPPCLIFKKLDFGELELQNSNRLLNISPKHTIWSFLTFVSILVKLLMLNMYLLISKRKYLFLFQKENIYFFFKMKKMYRINLIIKFKFSKNVSRYMYINIPESFFSFLDEYSIHKVV